MSGIGSNPPPPYSTSLKISKSLFHLLFYQFNTTCKQYVFLLRKKIHCEPHYRDWELPLLYFRTRPRLQQSVPCSWQSINWYHCAWCTTYQDSTVDVSIFFLLERERGKREKHRDFADWETVQIRRKVWIFFGSSWIPSPPDLLQLLSTPPHHPYLFFTNSIFNSFLNGQILWAPFLRSRDETRIWTQNSIAKPLPTQGPLHPLFWL